MAQRSFNVLSALTDKNFVHEIRASVIEHVADLVHATREATYPEDHLAGMRVPKGGSSCESCEYLADNKTDCTNKYFQKWNGSEKIPGKIDEYCSDWYEEKKDIKAGGPGSGRRPGCEVCNTNTKFSLCPKCQDAVEGYQKAHGVGTADAIDDLKNKYKTQGEGILRRYSSTFLGDLEKTLGLSLKSASETSLAGDYAGSLWNGIRIIGFTGPEEEGLKAMLSRVPPELLFNVKCIKSAPELNAKHGKFDPKTKEMIFNPSNFRLRSKMGQGEFWIFHPELTAVHEIGHSLYDSLTPEKKAEWEAIVGWIKGYKAGNVPPYTERRPGWEPMTSKWTHMPNKKFPRHYSEKNPNEHFADCFAFFILGKGHQMDKGNREFMEKMIHDNVKTYPSASIQSPIKAGKIKRTSVSV